MPAAIVLRLALTLENPILSVDGSRVLFESAWVMSLYLMGWVRAGQVFAALASPAFFVVQAQNEVKPCTTKKT